jgi:hypothetical protein
LPETIYRMEAEPLDLGPDVPAVSLELLDPETREPLTGPDAARIWAVTLPAIAAAEPWALDFFAHRERVAEFCGQRGIAFREAGASVLVIAQPAAELLRALFERFAGETFGARAGQLAASGDPGVEGSLARQGVDAYHSALLNYLFCAVCDFENGFLTLLTKRLWASEVIRRLRPELVALGVDVVRPAP